MNSATAQAVLLLKSIEEADPRGEVIAQSDRLWASREARWPEPEPQNPAADALSPAEASFLVRRADLLLPKLKSLHPAINTIDAVLKWRTGVGFLAALGSLALGLALNELGGSRRINIISFPMLGMLAWNIVVYALLAVEAIVHRPANSEHAGPRWGLARGLMHVATQRRLNLRPDDTQASGRLQSGLERFIGQWRKLVAPIYGARVRRLLHLCAALLAAGTVAGMYLRGIAFEYRAGWESTFLDENALHSALSIVLGPAAAISGISVPSPADLASIRWVDSQTGENAAGWIHLYAITAAIFIVIPRLILAAAATLAERRRSAQLFSLDSLKAYYRELMVEARGFARGGTVCVVSYSHDLSAAAQESLKSLLHQLLGDRIAIVIEPAIRYGDEEAYIEQFMQKRLQSANFMIVIFNIAATPEEENHGWLLAGLQRRIAESATRCQLIALLDESAYRNRFAEHSGFQLRLTQRKAAWEALARGHGVEIASLNLDGLHQAMPERERWRSAAWEAIRSATLREAAR